jgi:hypothetical protein
MLTGEKRWDTIQPHTNKFEKATRHRVLLHARAKWPQGSQGVHIMSWDFLQRYDESWIWRRSEGCEVAESNRNFAALEECIADAALHGYCGGQAGPERSRATRSADKSRRRGKTITA